MLLTKIETLANFEKKMEHRHSFRICRLAALRRIARGYSESPSRSARSGTKNYNFDNVDAARLLPSLQTRDGCPHLDRLSHFPYHRTQHQRERILHAKPVSAHLFARSARQSRLEPIPDGEYEQHDAEKANRVESRVVVPQIAREGGNGKRNEVAGGRCGERGSAREVGGECRAEASESLRSISSNGGSSIRTRSQSLARFPWRRRWRRSVRIPTSTPRSTVILCFPLPFVPPAILFCSESVLLQSQSFLISLSLYP